MAVHHLDQSTGARARRRRKSLSVHERGVTLPAGLTIALAIFAACALAAVAVMTKAGGLW